MGKQDTTVKIKQVLDTYIGHDGNDVREYFKIPYVDDKGDYNNINEVSSVYGGDTYYYPIVNIDEAISKLQSAKELRANFVSIWSNENHPEIRIEAFIVDKLTDDEVSDFEEMINNTQLLKHELELQEKRNLYEKLKKELGE